MKDKLKPCPFCGGCGHYYEEDTLGVVECSSCSATVETDIEDTDPKVAISAWNTRADGWVSVDSSKTEKGKRYLLYIPNVSIEKTYRCIDGQFARLMSDAKYMMELAPPEGCETILSHGVHGSIEYSEEDDCWHGKVVGIDDLVTYEADSKEGLVDAFEKSVAEWHRDRARADGWVSVDDKLPELGVQVLTLNKFGTYHLNRLLTEDLWSSVNTYHMLMMDYEVDEIDEPKVTHWQPLPAPPKGE